MKKRMKIISFAVLIAVVLIFGYVIYSNATKSNEQSLPEKVMSEIRYLEGKLIEIANQTNNIVMQNYKVSVKSIDESEGSSSDGGNTTSDSNTSGGGNNSGGGSDTGGRNGFDQSITSSDRGSSSGGGNSSGESNSGGSSSSSDSEESTEPKEQYSLNMVNPLTNTNTQIDWNDILNKIEEVYLAMPTITLDLYQTNINQQDILDFNSYLDNLTIEAKANNKENTLARICDMYTCLSKFVDAVSNDEAYKTSIKAKENVLKGYALVDLNRWNEVVQNVQNGTDVISALLTNTNIEPEKQMSINKSYVIINELKNAAQKQDKEIFFTKYKNLLEEMNSL